MKDYLQEVQQHAAALHITPLELCRRVGIAESTWQRWISGKVTPNISTLKKLLAYRGRAPQRRRRA